MTVVTHTYKVSDLLGLRVFLPEKTRSFGKVRAAVFAPGGRSVVGLLLRRPDIAGMIKRSDVFVARDSFILQKLTKQSGTSQTVLRITNQKTALGNAAFDRLQLDWDRCILWLGMPAVTQDGKKLGSVNDARFDADTGAVLSFMLSDGELARRLVGSVQIGPDMLLGYQDGSMVVRPVAAQVRASGGFAATAAEGFAQAQTLAKATAANLGTTVKTAVHKTVKQTTGKSPSDLHTAGSKALGRQLGRMGTMFSDFKAEYEKACTSSHKSSDEQ